LIAPQWGRSFSRYADARRNDGVSIAIGRPNEIANRRSTSCEPVRRGQNRNACPVGIGNLDEAATRDRFMRKHFTHVEHRCRGYSCL
jgi:hypothetical protein